MRHPSHTCPLPNPPHEGEGIVRGLRRDGAYRAKRHPPLHGEGWGGGVGMNEHFGPHTPILLSRLRGSMYSFSDTARRKKPRNIMTMRRTGMSIHHQVPTTSAEWLLAQ